MVGLCSSGISDGGDSGVAGCGKERALTRDVSDRRGMWLPNNMLGATSPGGRSGSPRALRWIPTVRVRAAVLRRPFQHVRPGSWTFMIININPSPFWTKPFYVSRRLVLLHGLLSLLVLIHFLEQYFFRVILIVRGNVPSFRNPPNYMALICWLLQAWIL